MLQNNSPVRASASIGRYAKAAAAQHSRRPAGGTAGLAGPKSKSQMWSRYKKNTYLLCAG